MFTFDTNAVIYHLAGDSNAVEFVRSAFRDHVPIYISAVTEAELFSFSKLTPADEILLDQLIETLSVIPVDSQIARIAAGVRRTYRLALPDSLIAATAIFTGSTLVTRNTRDFSKVTGLSVQTV